MHSFHDQTHLDYLYYEIYTCIVCVVQLVLHSSGLSKKCFICFLHLPSFLISFMSMEYASKLSSSGVSCTVIKFVPQACKWSSWREKIVGKILSCNSKSSLYFPSAYLPTPKIRTSPAIYSVIFFFLPRATTAIFPSGCVIPHFKWSLSMPCCSRVYSKAQSIS